MMGTMSTMNGSGDTKVIWDRKNKDETAAAKKTFDELRKKKFTAYNVSDGGKKTTVMTKFDPCAEKIIMVPVVSGG